MQYLGKVRHFAEGRLLMKRFLEILHGTRRTEWVLLIVALVILMMQFSENGTGQSDLETRMKSILSKIEGVGCVSVMVMENEEGQPEGALIVAEGATDVGVCLKLQQAVHNLLDMELSRIEVVQHD